MSVDLSNLPKIVQRRQRLGRGEGGGRGKTCGRGNKGQYARSKVRPGFEGGQMPLYRRLPKGGFKRPWRIVAAIVRLDTLNQFADNEEVTPDKLKQSGLVRTAALRVKILSGGELKKRLKVSVHGCSTAARASIESAGGSVELIP